MHDTYAPSAGDGSTVAVVHIDDWHIRGRNWGEAADWAFPETPYLRTR